MKSLTKTKRERYLNDTGNKMIFKYWRIHKNKKFAKKLTRNIEQEHLKHRGKDGHKIIYCGNINTNKFHNYIIKLTTLLNIYHFVW